MLRTKGSWHEWRWCGRRVLLGDGTTISLPDTEANQASYPQPTTQKPGLGFPLVRLVVLFSLATGLLHEVAMGSIQGDIHPLCITQH